MTIYIYKQLHVWSYISNSQFYKIDEWSENKSKKFYSDRNKIKTEHLKQRRINKMLAAINDNVFMIYTDFF